MLHPSFIDDIIFVLQLDGTNQYSFMIDELQKDSFALKSLSDIEKYLDRHKQLEIEKEMLQLTQSVHDSIVVCEEQEQQKKQEAEKALIKEALRKSKPYQTILSIAWLQMILVPIVFLYGTCYPIILVF